MPETEGYRKGSEMRRKLLGDAFVESLTKFPGRPVTPPEAIGVAVRWLLTTPEATQLLHKRIHLPAITQRHNLLPGWEGPGSTYTSTIG